MLAVKTVQYVTHGSDIMIFDKLLWCDRDYTKSLLIPTCPLLHHKKSHCLVTLGPLIRLIRVIVDLLAYSNLS